MKTGIQDPKNFSHLLALARGAYATHPLFRKGTYTGGRSDSDVSARQTHLEPSARAVKIVSTYS
jgi:hypothetical protein